MGKRLVEACEKHTKAFLSQPPRLFNCQNRFAGSSHALHSNPPVTPQQVQGKELVVSHRFEGSGFIADRGGQSIWSDRQRWTEQFDQCFNAGWPWTTLPGS